MWKWDFSLLFVVFGSTHFLYWNEEDNLIFLTVEDMVLCRKGRNARFLPHSITKSTEDRLPRCTHHKKIALTFSQYPHWSVKASLPWASFTLSFAGKHIFTQSSMKSLQNRGKKQFLSCFLFLYTNSLELDWPEPTMGCLVSGFTYNSSSASIRPNSNFRL